MAKEKKSVKTDGHLSKPETTFGEIEPDYITTPSNQLNQEDQCESFLSNVFDSYSNVHFIMAKMPDGNGINILGLDINRAPAKNSDGGFLFLSSLEVFDKISNIFEKVSLSRNAVNKNIIIFIDRSLKVIIFVDGQEDYALSGKHIDNY
jgi:hypothetical protein